MTKAITELTRLRGELAQAEADLQSATADRDAARAAAARTRLVELRGFVADAEKDASVELEADAKRRAKRWAKDARAALEGVADEIRATQEQARPLLEQLLECIRYEGKLRGGVRKALTGIEVLSARWPEIGSAVKEPVLPEFFDCGGEIIRLESKDILSPRRRRLSLSHVASDSPERMAALAARAAFEFASTPKRAAEMPTEVVQIITSAPPPPEPPAPQKSPGLSEAAAYAAIGQTRGTL